MLLMTYRPLAERCNKTTHRLCENPAGVATLRVIYDGDTSDRPHQRGLIAGCCVGPHTLLLVNMKLLLSGMC